ncbi:uncharacterized protein LOC126568905 [Anopheles aquasalis]|uniref:uncharacterized protein LOC126568905 n=1 Tax=Anopheles aquasalis TaxID=42839 RepID=UPI00215A75CB|nr:uncharacterized protein LOC126568905 [Anopheles aquasalis]
MLRFGGLKYKKLNNASAFCGDESDAAAGGGRHDVPSTPSKTGKREGHGGRWCTTPGQQQQQQQRVHNQLNGSTMKNVNTSAHNGTAIGGKRPKNNLLLVVGGLSGKSFHDGGNHTASQPTSPSSNFKLLSGKFSIDSKRKSNCKTRIYKCIKRILKRNTFGSSAPIKEHRGSTTAAVPSAVVALPIHSNFRPLVPLQLRGSNPDYREIKTLLEKQHRKPEYDVNLAKCVEKPAFIKKIALNLLQSAVVEGGTEDSSLVLQREHESSVTGAIQTDVEREREYQRLLGECWYHENLPRNLSLELLTDKQPGHFLVRKSTTQPDCYALSLRVPPGTGTRIAHYLIVRTATDGYKIKGFQKEFSSLRALIVHHSVMPEALPIPLALPRPTDLVVKTKFEDDYETVFDLTNSIKN